MCTLTAVRAKAVHANVRGIHRRPAHRILTVVGVRLHMHRSRGGGGGRVNDDGGGAVVSGSASLIGL